jgi:hypothetical protein
LRAHGSDWFRDRLRGRRFHLPRIRNVAATEAIAGAIVVTGGARLVRTR